MAKTPHGSVDDYLATLSPEGRKVLQQVRKALQAAVPDGREVISYNVPALKTTGFVAYFPAFAKHWSFSSPPSGLHKAFAKQLAPYKVSKSAIQFPLDEPLPVKLVQDMARFRADEVAKATAAKATKTAQPQAKKLARSAPAKR